MVNIIISGGPVMIPLLLCSVAAVAIGLERLWYLLRTRVDTEDLMEDIQLALGQGKVLEAMQIAKKSRGPVAAILSGGIAYYDRDKHEIKERMQEIREKMRPESQLLAMEDQAREAINGMGVDAELKAILERAVKSGQGAEIVAMATQAKASEGDIDWQEAATEALGTAEFERYKQETIEAFKAKP